MLKYIKVKNFLSFKEETEINFESNFYGKKKDNSFKIGNNNDVLMKNMLIYGANASGKSNIIKAIKIIKLVALRDNLPKNIITPFLLDTNSKENFSFFEIGFFIKNKEFVYNFQIFDGKILSENLLQIKKINKEIRKEILFKRDNLEIIAGESFEKELEKGKDKIKENSSIISVLSRWNGKLSGKSIDYFFKKIKFILAKNDLIDFKGELNTINFLGIKNNIESKKFLIYFLKLADINIDDIKIEEREIPAEVMEQLISLENENIFGGFNDLIKTKIEFGHKINGSKKLEYFDLENESDGTRKLFSILGPIVDTIFNEGILFVDEIENKLHLHILQEIIKFINSNIQGKKYQFFFTTHNIGLMDLKVLKKEQIGIVEKNRDGKSEFYTLYDFDKVREGIDIKKYFNAGIYGGVPNVGDFKSLLNNFNLGEKEEK